MNLKSSVSPQHGLMIIKMEPIIAYAMGYKLRVHAQLMSPWDTRS